MISPLSPGDLVYEALPDPEDLTATEWCPVCGEAVEHLDAVPVVAAEGLTEVVEVRQPCGHEVTVQE